MSTTKLHNLKISAEIKHLGAELISLKTNNNKEYIWEGNPVFWGKHAPILFPIVGTLKNNSFQHEGNSYQLSRHGFAREMDFELIQKTKNSAVFSIKSDVKTLKTYPFPFELQIAYTLTEQTLDIDYKVINTGEIKMPFSIGAHPAFALPQKFSNYSLLFDQEESATYYVLENDLISDKTQTISLKDKKMHLEYALFDNDALIFKTLKSKTVSILENNQPVIKVSFPSFPSLGIWTKRDAPFICIEPWFGYSDTFDSTGNLFEKEGIQVLEPHGLFQSRYSIEIL